MIRKNSFLVSAIIGILLIISALYFYDNTSNKDLVYILIIPLFFIFQRLGIFNPSMLVTKKEIIKILIIIYVLLSFVIIYNSYGEDQPFHSMANGLLGLSLFYLIFAVPLLIVLYFIPFLILKYANIKIGKLKNVYDPYQASLFINQRLNNDLTKKITEENILEMIIIKYDLSGKGVEYINKYDFKTNISDDEAIRLVKEKFNNKFNEYEIAEIFKIEKLYIKELGF